MADTDLESLTARATALGTDILYLVDPVTNLPYNITMSALNAYMDPASNSSTTAQALGTADTYLSGSNCSFGAGRLKAGSYYRAQLDMTKTAAGVAVATITLRVGTTGTTTDAARCTFTFPSAQTAAADNARFSIYANVRTVGSGTTAVIQGVLVIERTNTTTGFLSTGGLQFMAPIRVTSSGFDSTTATTIGLSINAGAASAWTTQLVQADIKNLA